MRDDERDEIDAELGREVAASLRNLEPGIPEEITETFALELIAEFHKRRIVLYRRAEHRLPPGLVQTKVEDYIEEKV